jgi:16S rRNA (cytosine967-C5)-methyltransferase
MNDTRALAAAALADIALRGQSLREAVDRTLPKIGDPRDRALFTALLNEGARWWPRYDVAVDRLLDKPLRKQEPAIHALLVLGLIQIEVLEMPGYAAVAATVEAARALRRPRHAGLVNAILRRWQRERESLLAALDAEPATRHAHPAWLAEAITADWPEQAADIFVVDNQEPPLMLRANRRRTTRAALVARLEAAGQPAAAHPWLVDAIVLPHSTDVTRLPGFRDGHFAVQDGSAQIAVDLLDVRDGQRVLDACAAPGGKACHLLERADIALVAVESDAHRVPRIRQNLERLGLAATLVTGDAGDPSAWWDGKPFDRILIDAPCSATGVMRRRPDVRLHRRADDIGTLGAQQRRIVEALWPLLAPGGRLVYVTCSLLRAENAGIVAAFARAHDDANLVPIALPDGQSAGTGWQVLPGDGDLDGMYYAIVAKKDDSAMYHVPIEEPAQPA